MFKRLVESYLGVSPAEPGQGTAWKVSFHPPWPADWPSWCVLSLLVALIAFVVVISLRDSSALPRKIRALLLCLRLLSLGVVGLFLTGLSLSVERTGLPFAVVMIDDSASMGLVDRYQQEDDRSAIASLVGKQQAESVTRLELAKALLTHDDGQFLKRLQQNHKVRLYRFSDAPVLMGSGESVGPEAIDRLLPEITELEPHGDETRPGPALKKVLDDLRGTPPAAIILLTDGIASAGAADKLTAVAPEALRRLVPVYCVGLGSSEPVRDLQLFDMLSTDVAFVDDPIDFSAKLKAYGLEGREARLELRRKDDAQVLASETVRIPADGRSLRVDLTFAPTDDGEFDFVLNAAIIPDAKQRARETNLSNNSEIRHVSVRRQKIRVLLADSIPRYEFRFVKHLLERDKTIELHTILQEADLEFSSEDQTALPYFPVKRGELYQHDVIILGDVDPAQLNSGTFDDLQNFVREAGGGLILIAGESFNPTSYRGTPIETMIPVELDRVERPDPASAESERFYPRLTLEGQKGTTIFRFSTDADENRNIWSALPELRWMLRAPALKSGAVVFLEHPSRSGNEGNLPVIAMQRYGAGKVLFHATDELHRWRYRAGDRYYARYWIQAIRYLSRSRLLGRSRAAELTTDRVTYERGEAVSMRLRFFDERLIPSNEEPVNVVVERRNERQRTVTLAGTAGVEGVFEGMLRRAGPGTYHAWVSSPTFEGAPPSANFRIEAPVQELRIRSLARAELKQTADVTHGRLFRPANCERLPDVVPAGFSVPLNSEAPIPIWNRWELLVLFVAAVCGEWFLRKRFRLV